MFITDRSTIIGKIESTPYTAETLASADFDIELENLEYSAEIKEFQRKVLDGTLDSYNSVMGKQSGSVNFMTCMNPGAAVNTEPKWAKYLKACGYAQTAHGSTGISWHPHADNTHIPMTIEIQEINHGTSPSLLVTRLGGCMGEVAFMFGELGEPVQMVFTDFKGSLLSIEDRPFGSLLSPTGVNTTASAAVLGAAVTVGGVEQVLEKFEIKTGNTVAFYSDPSKSTGVKGAYIASRRESTLSIDPYSDLLANDPVYTRWLAGTTGAVSITVDDGTNPAIVMSAPVAQYSTVNVGGEREGARVNEKVFRLHKSSGNDSIEILQGAKA